MIKEQSPEGTYMPLESSKVQKMSGVQQNARIPAHACNQEPKKYYTAFAKLPTYAVFAI